MDIPFSCLSLVGRSRNGKRERERERDAVSCRMYLVIVLFLVPQVRAFMLNSYNGFDRCGENGWICERIHPGTEVTFDCSLTRSQDGRLWIWTARLPSRIRKVTATNCNHLELHVDCTTNSRETKIEQFRLINIRKLTIVRPTNMYEVLHDNAPVPHIPPYFHMENISRVNFYSGLFRGEHLNCNYNVGGLKKMVMKNVHVGKVDQGSFDINLEEIIWSNVTFENINSGAIAINGTSMLIENSRISEIQSKAIVFNSKNVTFTSNRFSTIGPGSLNVYSHGFKFSHNKINEIMSRGLVVRSSNVEFENNVIADLAKEALGAISPAYYISDGDVIAHPFTYTFTGNEILFMNRFSLHPDWKSYGGNSCVKIRIDGNKFNCDCENLIWLRQYTQDGSGENVGFYKMVLNTTHHCGTNSNCSLSAIIPYVCQNNSNLAVQCAGLNEKENFDDVNLNATEAYDASVGSEGDLASEVADTFEWRGSYSHSDDDSEMILDKSYYTDKSFGDSSGLTASIWAAIVVAVIIKSVCILAAFVWYIKRKARYNAVEIYKYDKTNDSDTLITQSRVETAGECENPSFP